MKKHDWYRAFFVFARGIKPSLQIVVSFGIVGAILYSTYVSVLGIS